MRLKESPGDKMAVSPGEAAAAERHSTNKLHDHRPLYKQQGDKLCRVLLNTHTHFCMLVAAPSFIAAVAVRQLRHGTACYMYPTRVLQMPGRPQQDSSPCRTRELLCAVGSKWTEAFILVMEGQSWSHLQDNDTFCSEEAATLVMVACRSCQHWLHVLQQGQPCCSCATTVHDGTHTDAVHDGTEACHILVNIDASAGLAVLL